MFALVDLKKMTIKEKILNIFHYKFSTPEKIQINRRYFDQEVYVSFDYAIKEIERRRKDPELKEKIEKYLGEIPKPFEMGINAVLFRFIATPQFETKRFYDIVTGFGIRPLFWEYYNDKFHSGNHCKYTLGKLFIYKGMGKTNKSIIKKETILDFNTSNGKQMKELFTIKGEKFIDFHHKLLERIIPDSREYLFDASDWLKSQGGKSDKYYEKFLVLFLCHGVLFENFLLDKTEFDFNQNIFLPAFLKIEKEFGIKPLIVAIAPTEIEGSEFWNSYPHQIEDVL